MNIRILLLIILCVSLVPLSGVPGGEPATGDAFTGDREIRFASATPGVSLAGTITLPDNNPPRAGAVLLSVAGPTDRDGTLGPHKFMGKLARELSALGIASLRYDARGVGDSEGDLLQTGLADRAGDACRAMETLRGELAGQPDGTVPGIGYIGMSEGGGVGLLAAETCGSPDFGVLLSTPVRPGLEVMKGQLERMLAMSPLQEADRESMEKSLKRFLELVSAPDAESRRDQIEELLSAPGGRMILPAYGFVPSTPEGQADFVLTPWYQSQLKYDVRPYLERADYPLRAVYGSLDRVIDPQRNAEVVRELNPGAGVSVRMGLNHLMQEAETGMPAEYAKLPESVSAEVCRAVGDWILGL